MVGSATMCRPNVLVSIVTVSTVFHLICPVRFCNCHGGAEVDCGCDRTLSVDYRVFAEEVGLSGCAAGCGHVITCLLFSVGWCGS